MFFSKKVHYLRCFVGLETVGFLRLKMHNLTGYATIVSNLVARNVMESGFKGRTSKSKRTLFLRKVN